MAEDGYIIDGVEYVREAPIPRDEMLGDPEYLKRLAKATQESLVDDGLWNGKPDGHLDTYTIDGREPG